MIFPARISSLAKSSNEIFSFAGFTCALAISLAFLVASNLSICRWICSSSIFSNNNPGSFSRCPAGTTSSPIRFQAIGAIFRKSLNFDALNGINGSVKVDRSPAICKQIFNIVFTRASSVLINFQGSVSARYLFPKRARFIHSLSPSRKWKLSRFFSTRLIISGISANTSLS